MFAIRPWAVCAAIACVSIGSASAAIVTLPAVRDTTIFSDAVSNSSGAGAVLFVGGVGPGTTGAPTGVRRVLLAFDIASSIPAGSTITGAELRLTTTQVSQSTGFQVGLHRVTADWGEGASNAGNNSAGAAAQTGDATWNDRFFGSVSPWTSAGGDFVGPFSDSVNVGLAAVTYIWSSPQTVSDVAGWLANPASNFGWLLKGDETTDVSEKRFDSSEATAQFAQPPSLRVTFTAPIPEPETYAMMLAGLGMLAWVRRRRT